MFWSHSSQNRITDFHLYIHSVYSLRIFTPYTHSVYSLRIFTPYIHSVYSLCIFTPYIHFVYSLAAQDLICMSLSFKQNYLITSILIFHSEKNRLDLNFVKNIQIAFISPWDVFMHFLSMLVYINTLRKY